MKTLLTCFVILFCSIHTLFSQTWTGSVNTSWSNAGNWSPATVPGAGSNVTIPTSVVSNKWPALSANTTINGITMSDGSQLNMNGFALNLTSSSVYNTISGTINNTNAATDIVLNINTGGGGYTTYVRSTVFNDHVIFNLSGNNQFLESDNGSGNIFNGNADYNISSGLSVRLSVNGSSLYKANLNITRTMAGPTDMFYSGGNVTGNFSFINSLGGDTRMGTTATKTLIGGKVDISIISTVNQFALYRLINQTSGGIITAQNTRGFDLQLDSLKLSSLSVTGYQGSAYAYLFNNSITGNVTIADDAAYSGGYNLDIRSNVFTGVTTFTNNGSNATYEGNAIGAANVYNGNTTFNMKGSGALYLSHADQSQFKGNLVISRTNNGFTQVFNNGGKVTGSFTFSVFANGTSLLGNPGFRTLISGTLNVTVKNTTTSDFGMYHLLNQTNGGSLSLDGTKAFDFRNDTLLLTGFSIQKYTGNAYAYLYNNDITGTITVADDASYSGGYNLDIKRNFFNGNAVFTNNGSNNTYDANEAAMANIYNGNTTFNMKGSGALYLSHLDASQFKGNLTVSRTADGQTQVFNAGATVTGNFIYNVTANGNSILGNTAARTLINGTLNLIVKNSSPGNFGMYRIINKTNGGLLSLDSTKAFDVRNDTLLLTSMTCKNYYGNAYAYLYNNDITGTITVADDASYSGGFSLDIKRNVFNGNAVFTNNGSNNTYDANEAAMANIYNGNTAFNMKGSGALYLSHLDASQFKGNLTVSRTSNGNNQLFNGGASVTGNLIYTVLANGNSTLGNLNNRTQINGTLNVSVKNTSPGSFMMYRIINKINGGSLSIDSTLAFDVRNDTLLLNSFSCLNYYGNAYAILLRNDITGAVTVADDAAYTSGYNLTIENNRFTGNCSFTHKGTNSIAEATAAGSANMYNGNTVFAMMGQGSLFVSHSDASKFNGDLTVSRTIAAGITQVFNTAGQVTGNFTFNNNIGGDCKLGNTSAVSTIAGQFNMNVNHIPASTGGIYLYGIKNLTTGGTISMLNTRAFDLRNDTLNAISLTISGYRGNAYAYALNNQLTADVTIADDVSYTSGFNTTLRNNVINGNTIITVNGSNNLNDAEGGGTAGDVYNGNVSFVRNGTGLITIGQSFVTEVTKDFKITGSGGISIPNLRFKGSTNTIVSKAGTIPITVANLYFNKTGAGNIILNDSVMVSKNGTFVGGKVISSAAKELIFLNNATQTGASDASHVKGPVSKIGNQAFAFPVGNGVAIQKAAITAPAIATDRFRAEYFDISPHPLYDTSKHAASLNNVSGAQYWIVERLVGSSNVTLTLDYGKPRGVSITAVQANFRVAKWSGATWQDLGNGGTTGTVTEGSVMTAAPVTAFSPFTIAATTGINPMPNTTAPLASPACANTTVTIPFQTSGVFNPGNQFTAQLSDASGSFANPVNIGTLALAPDGINVSNSIAAFLPSSAIITGNGYRVRVVSNNPVNLGTTNASNLTINSLYVGKDTTVLLNCGGTTVDLTTLYNTTGLSPVWNTADPSSVLGGVYRLSVQNNIGCRDTAFATVIFEIATWTGAVSSDWHTAANWSTNKIPAAKTHVIITTGNAKPCIISTANATAASVQIKNGSVLNTINNTRLVITGKCAVLPPS